MRMLKRATALLLTVCLILPALSGLAESAGGVTAGTVRVWLSSLGQPAQVDLTVYGSYSLDGSSATAIASGSALRVTLNAATGRLTLTRGGVATDMGTDFRLRRHGTEESSGVKISQARASGNLYPGDVRFLSVLSGGQYRLYVIVHVFVEDYLYGVLPYEMGNSAPLEALKAQCVAARTYTLRAMQSAGSRTYDVVDTTNDQVYNGTPTGNDRCRQAVDETRGVALAYNGALAAAYYTASNGGQTESLRNIWGTDGCDYLSVRDDPYDLDSAAAAKRAFSVSAAGTQSNATLGSLLAEKAKTVFSASNVTVTAVTAVTPHTPRYAAPSRLYTKLDFAVNALCDGVNRSGTLTFDIFSELETPLGMSINGGDNELWSVQKTASGYTVEARRFGHGAGLSQRGAMRMAELGYSYEQILAFYFEGCSCAQYTLVRATLSALGTGASGEISTAEAPAAISGAAAAAGIVQMASMTERLSLHVSAASTADVIAGLPHGAVVAVHAAVNGWYLVTWGALTGYTQQAGVRLTGKPDGQNPNVTTLAAYGTVTGSDSLHLRAGASTATASLGLIPAGTVLPLLSVSDGWGYTQYGAQRGYVSLAYIRQSDRYSGDARDADAVGALTTAGMPLYLSAAPTAYQAAAVPQGAAVRVLYDDGSWSQITYAGVTGYVPSAVLQRTGSVIAAAADTPKSGEQYATVKSSSGSLNLRAQASMSAAVMMEIAYGETVIVESAGDTWCRVRYHGVTGWCASQYLALGSSGQNPSGEDTLSATVTTASGSLNLRKGDSTQTTVLTTIPRFATITVLSRGATWSKVTYGGFIGYVMSKYLTFGSVERPTATPAPQSAATPSAQQSAAARVTTASGSLNLRKTAATSAAILARIPRLAMVQVLDISGTWTHVIYNGKTGYVMSAFLTYLTNAETAATATPIPAQTPAMQTETLAQVTTASGSLNLRKTANASAEILTRIPQYTMLTVLRRQGTWTQVEYQQRTGYVMTTFLTFVSVQESAAPQPTENVSGMLVTAQVTTQRGSLNLRERAASSAKVLTTVPQYAWLTVLSRGNTWSQVSYGGHTGYVMSSFLTFSSTAATPTPAPATGGDEPYARVTTQSGSLNLRARAASGATILTTVPQYATVTVLEKGAVWSRVSYNGTEGYVKTEFLTFYGAPAAATEALTALSTPVTAQVAGDGDAVLREAADPAAAALAVIARGEYVRVTARGSGWCRVDYDGRTGYLPTACLELP